MKKLQANKDLTNAQVEVLRTYTSFVKENGRVPTEFDLRDIGMTRDKVRYHFGNMTTLKRTATEFEDEAIIEAGVVDEELFTPEAKKKMLGAVKKHKRFIITTAVGESEIHEDFYESLKTYCEANKALLLVIPTTESLQSTAYRRLNKILRDEVIVFEDLRLNSNLIVSTIRVSAKQIDPISGLARIGQREGSLILGSPKQRMKPVPVANSKMPHVLMTTGAVTIPEYKKDEYLNKRSDCVAHHDHVFGAVVVEVVDNDIFHFRHVQADPKTGHFFDLGVEYSPYGSKFVGAEALVLGDLHSGQTDQEVLDCFKEVAQVTKAKRIVVHDGFDAFSISHHHEGRELTKASKAMMGFSRLDVELAVYAKALNGILNWNKDSKVVVVKSNHDEHLERYLNEARYAKDPENHYTGAVLAVEMLDGEDPLLAGISIFGDFKPNKRVVWLERDQDYTVEGVQLGDHGDVGANGSKGSMPTLENAHYNAVVGHSHAPEILRGVHRVGTCSIMELEYNRGPSSWMHTSCLVYKGGSRQLINVIFGQWRA